MDSRFRYGARPRTPDLSGSSASLSVRAVPNHPGKPNDCACLCLRRPCWLHHLWQTGRFHCCVSRPNRVRLRYGSHRAPHRASIVLLPSRSPVRLHVSQAFHMVSSFQPTREARLILTHQRRKRNEVKTFVLCASATSMRRQILSRPNVVGPADPYQQLHPGPLFYSHSSRTRCGVGASWGPLTRSLALPTLRRSLWIKTQNAVASDEVLRVLSPGRILSAAVLLYLTTSVCFMLRRFSTQSGS